jgi:hypothetical protein
MTPKLLIFCCIFARFGGPQFARAQVVTDSLFRTPAQNRHWLASLKQQALASQWRRIQSRYFRAQEATSPSGSVTALPILLVDGLAVERTSTGMPIWNLVATHLTTANLKTIAVIEREPSGVYINKASTGWIVVTVADNSLNRMLQRASKRTNSR